jgi:DNA primase
MVTSVISNLSFEESIKTMDWVSFEEIKKKVTLQMAIERYGIPLRRLNATTLRGRCPLPVHQSEKSAESFTATLNKGTGGAWACQSQSCKQARGRVGGNVLDFVAAMEQCSVRDAAIKLQTWFLVQAAGEEPEKRKLGDGEPSWQGTAEPKPEESAAGGCVSNQPLTFALQRIDDSHPYLAGRGITEETTRNFGAGFFPGKGTMSGRVVIPIHNPKGECVAYAGRSIDGTEPRYKFPAGFHKSLELFNLHRTVGEFYVVVVEGFFDCMKVSQAGFPCVALMGCTMSAAQQRLLSEHFSQVILMLDGDDAGRGAAEEIGDGLQQVIYMVKTIELADGVQPDQLSAEEIRNILSPVV